MVLMNCLKCFVVVSCVFVRVKNNERRFDFARGGMVTISRDFLGLLYMVFFFGEL